MGNNRDNRLHRTPPLILAPALTGLILGACSAWADDDLPAVDFFNMPSASEPRPTPKPGEPDLGLLIEGDIERDPIHDGAPRAPGSKALGLLMIGDGSKSKILYEDDYHQVIGNPAWPSVRMMYRYDPATTDWKYDGSIVRGHLMPNSNFGWSVAVTKPYLAIMDWNTKAKRAAIIIYEKTPSSVRGWKKRFEVIADNSDQAKCMGGLEADKWLGKWMENGGEDCGVRTVDGTQATNHSIHETGRY